ncbi:MAG TPA: DNA polymerase I [Polyangiaceae bacterium]|nr:DNA polymerase I [Polyangiaceae bacterium]
MVSRLFEPGARDVLYVVDVSGYVFRAYHAIAPLTSPSGEPTQAVLGTVNMLELLIKERDPLLLAVAMDSGKQTFRRELYSEYKAHRPEAPPDLRSQMRRVEQVLQALRVPIFVSPGVEADDLIASMVVRARQLGLRTVIVSADKDLMPLVGPDVLLWDTMRDRVWGPEEVSQRFGVRVNQVRDWLALTGDSSDNIPGVPSVGPKTAQQLLTAYEDLDGIYARLGEIERKKLRETLEQHREQAFLSRRLVTLKDDCPLEFSVAGLARAERDYEALHAIYSELGFQRHLLAVQEARSAARPVAAALPVDSVAVAVGVAAPDGAVAAAALVVAPPEPPVESLPTLISSAEDLAQLLDAAERTGKLGIVPALQQVGNRDHLIGLGLSVQPHSGHYLPLSHRYLGAPVQLSRDVLHGALARALAGGRIALAGYDVKRVRVALEESVGKLDRPEAPLSAAFGFDASLASYLVDPEVDNALEALADRELGLKLGAVEALTRPRRGAHIALDELNVEELGSLLGDQAMAVVRLWPVLEARLIEGELSQLFQEVELPLSQLLAELELRGVLVDVSLLAELGSQIDARLLELEREAEKAAGRAFNIHSPRQLEALLFDELGLAPQKRTKTSRSTDAATLEALSDEHPLPAIVLEIRKLSKLKGTYIEALPGLVNPATGRIHTRWGQTTAATGRLASSDPNLQNIPIRSDLGKAIRHAFVAPPGYQLISADYSQIELRVLAHLSKDPVLASGFREAEDVHTRTAMEIFGLARGDVTAEHRRRAKAVNFGVIYGQGEQGLAKSLGITRAEAGQFIAAYFRRYQGVRDFMESTLQSARQSGTVRTLLGRLRRVPELRSGHQGRRSAAERVVMNTPIQGSAADLLKLAMLALRQPVTPGCRMTLTVHDELVFEVPEAEVEQAASAIRQRMESIYPLDVPLVVDVGHGRAWDEAH